MKDNMTRLGQEMLEAKRRLDRLEDNDKRHEDDIRMLYANQEATKAYVTQILAKIDSLESKLFNLVTQLTANQEADRKADRVENAKSTTGWQELIKYILFITVGIIVAYLFSGGK